MDRACRMGIVITLAALTGACAGSSSTGSVPGGTAQVLVDGATYEVRDVTMRIAPGEDAFFQIEGEPVAHADQDCVPGLGGGLFLYGDLPAPIHRPADLAGKRLRVDFSGDGDDANFCFLGMGGLAGAEDAWVTIDTATDDRITFSMTGTYKIYDENGEGPVRNVSGSGTALCVREDS